MRVVTLGAGAIGGYFANVLARAGHDVTVLARGTTLKALRANGLRIRNGPDEGEARVDAVGELDPDLVADLVFVATKTYDTDAVCAAAQSPITKDTIVLPLQNGANRAEVVRDLLPDCTVLGGTVFMESVASVPGEVRYIGGPRRIVMGGYTPAARERARWLGRILADAGINVAVVDDVARELWKKFVLVCAGNALTSLTRSSLGQILSDAEGRRLVGEAMRESVCVATKLGVGLGEDYVDTGIDYLVGMGANARSSMLADVEAERLTEVDALNGYIVDQGSRVGVDVPLNRLITLSLRLHNRRVATNA